MFNLRQGQVRRCGTTPDIYGKMWELPEGWADSERIGGFMSWWKSNESATNKLTMENIKRTIEYWRSEEYQKKEFERQKAQCQFQIEFMRSISNRPYVGQIGRG
jgi:hypothetical protein